MNLKLRQQNNDVWLLIADQLALQTIQNLLDNSTA